MSLTSVLWRGAVVVSLGVGMAGSVYAAPGDGELSSTDVQAVAPGAELRYAGSRAGADTARFVARKEPVESLFTALGSEIRKPLRLSRKIRQYRISGDFDLAHPFEVLDRVASTLGLIWYYDGQVIYVYDSSEATSVMLSISPGQVDELMAFLKNASLYDQRFPIRYTSGTGVIYVSGPPKYVDIVQNAASMLRKASVAVDDDERRIEVVRLRHAFVADREYQRRDVQSSVPGLASVLSDAFGGGLAMVSVAAQSGSSDPDAAVPPMASALARPVLALPPGVAEIPSMNAVLPMDADASTPVGPQTDFSAVPGGSVAMRVVAYPSNNSLLLEGTDSQIAMARRLIAQLDVPRDQVELSLWVIDVQKQDLDELGAQWGATGRIGPVEVGFNASVLGQGATLSRSQTRRFIASVVALSEKNKARIVSRPILLAQDNSPAIFDNSKSFYVKVHGERTANLYKVTYGTMIDVVPHVVDPNGRIEMELDIEDGNSSSPGDDSHLDLPVVSSTKISTMARVQHAQSILVGGYTQDQKSERVSKIPLLGDIPFVGGLFRYRTDTASQSVRLFLIQPRLLPDENQFDAWRVATPRQMTDTVDVLRQQLEKDHV